jgi:hypothetical protein
MCSRITSSRLVLLFEDLLPSWMDDKIPRHYITDRSNIWLRSKPQGDLPR